MGNINYDNVVKLLLKSKSNFDIDCVLDTANIDDCKEIIKILLSRYNNMVVQGMIEMRKINENSD